jgi:aerobic carbon-monoxide dehydrogenase large subunit
MKSLRVFAAAAVLSCLAACVSAPTKEAAPTPTPAVPAGPNVAGTWVLTVESPMGTRDSDAIFTQTGQALSGKMVSPRGEAPFTGTLKGDDIAFALTINAQGQTLQLDYAGKVTGDTMGGTVQFGSFGEGKWSGKRKAQ